MKFITFARKNDNRLNDYETVAVGTAIMKKIKPVQLFRFYEGQSLLFPNTREQSYENYGPLAKIWQKEVRGPPNFC